jgi:ferredoxin
MKLVIDRNVCDGHGMCAQSAPAFFSLDEEGDPVIASVDIPDAIPAVVSLAVRACPVSAISIAD